MTDPEFIRASRLYDPATGRYLYPWIDLQIEAAHHRHARTDGGHPNPTDSPYRCSKCGVYLTGLDDVQDHTYCRSCRDEYLPTEYRGGEQR